MSPAQVQLSPVTMAEPLTREEWAAAIHRVLAHYHCADQSPAGARYDSTVQGRTAIGPYGGKNHRMPTNIYVSAPLRGKPNGVITTLAFNPYYGELSAAGMARLMMFEAITKAVVAGADYRQMVLCDNFYTPRVRPEVAFELNAMVETIAHLSLELGVPFISGKDSSSGTLEAGGQRIDVPPRSRWLPWAGWRMWAPSPRRNLSGRGIGWYWWGSQTPEVLGGTVYADCYGERGDRLFDAYDSAAMREQWDALLGLHHRGNTFQDRRSGEGGVFLRSV